MQCDHFSQNKCRSCAWLDRGYADQLIAKTADLRAQLEAHHPQEWLPAVASPQTGFRNKAKMVVLGTQGAPILGIVNHQGEVVSLCDCPLYPADMQALLQHLQVWVQQAGLQPYQVDKREGELKFILLTRSQFSGEYLMRLVLRSEQPLAHIRQCLPQLLADHPNVSVVSVNIQPVHMAILEGEKEIFLTPRTSLSERLNGVPLYIRPKSFFQTNPVVAAELYATAGKWTAEIRPKSLLDLYCGVGGFGLHCATSERSMTGIEIAPEAIACAQQSAREMGLDNVNLIVSDLKAFAAMQSISPDLIILNPPRRGVGGTLCAQLLDMAPQHILYSSCNAQTLAQDLSQLRGYQLARVQLFDMFPHTPHYEVLTMLTRLGHTENQCMNDAKAVAE